MKKGKNGFYCTTATINGKRKYFYGKTPQIAVEKRNSLIAKVKDFPYLDDHVTQKMDEEAAEIASHII